MHKYVENANKRALYPLSGDPIHNGHLETIKNAALLFEEVIVGFAVNDDNKTGLFTITERMHLANKAIKHLNLKNVSLVKYDNLTVDYARRNGIAYLVKGVRNEKDFGYARSMALENKKICPFVNTVILLATKYENVSSTLVKQLIKHNANVSDYVPMRVKKALEIKQGQCIIGITGEIGAGKSFIARHLKETIDDVHELESHIIELDDISHSVLGIEGNLKSLQDEEFRATRKQLRKAFGKDIGTGYIYRDALAKKIWGNKERNKELNRIIGPPMLRVVREKMQKIKGVIMLVTGILAEAELSYLCNNNVILIYNTQDRIMQNMKDRGLTNEEISLRQNSMLTFDGKIAELEKRIKKDGAGHIWKYDNSKEDVIYSLSENILNDIY